MPLYSDFETVSNFDYDTKAINNAVKNILLTPIGSLPGKPDFGSRINEIIFSQMDYITIDLLKRLIQEALYKWEKRIIVTNIEISDIPEYNRLVAQISYRYRDSELNKSSSVSVNLRQ